MKNFVVITGLCIATVGCGGGGDGDGGTNQSQESLAVADDSANFDDGGEVVDADNAIVSSGSNSEMTGTWLNCESGGTQSLGRAWEFTETTFRTYFSVLAQSDCSDLFTLENSTQGGTYRIVQERISREGLPVVEVELDINDVFGGVLTEDELLAPTVFANVYVDGNSLYLGSTRGADIVDLNDINFSVEYIKQ